MVVCCCIAVNFSGVSLSGFDRMVSGIETLPILWSGEPSKSCPMNVSLIIQAEGPPLDIKLLGFDPY